MKKNEMLAFELSSCHSSITSLKILNDDLNARIEKLSVASSSIEHVSICAKYKDHDFNACSNHASIIAKLNNEIAHLNVQLKRGHILCNHLFWCKHAIKRSGASDLDLMMTVILYLTPST
jgi:hypothetical protein